MKFVRSLEKAFLSLFFFFVSCSPRCHNWDVDCIKGCTPCMSSRKISSWEMASCKKVRLEFIRTSCQLYGYLDILSPFILKGALFDDYLEFNVISDFGDYPMQAIPLEGNQRFLLPVSETAILLDLFYQGADIQIKIGRYTAKFSSLSFIDAYNKF